MQKQSFYSCTPLPPAWSESEERARELLRSCLSTAEWNTYQRSGFVYHVTRRGAVYRIGYSSLINRLDRPAEYCVIVKEGGYLPRTDLVLAKLLLLRNGGSDFRRVANRIEQDRIPAYDSDIPYLHYLQGRVRFEDRWYFWTRSFQWLRLAGLLILPFAEVIVGALLGSPSLLIWFLLAIITMIATVFLMLRSDWI